VTSAERALALVVQKHDRCLDVPGCKRFAASLPNGSAYSLADLDDALWLSEVIDDACDEATNLRDYEIASLMRDVDALKEKIDDMRHDALERGER